MRVLIVDDEPLARTLLRSFLEKDPEIATVESCANGSEAVQALNGSSFDLVFLDVQMPDLDGFRVLEQRGEDERPIVIFVTAFEEHAVRAFSFGAVDYLVKPFDDLRFQSALERAKVRHRERMLGRRGEELAELVVRAADMRSAAERRITLQSGGRIVCLDPGDVFWVEAQDKHVLYHVTDEEPVRARQTLAEVEQLLDPRRFLRVHRSCIVALDKVTSLERTEGGATYVRLSSDARVVVSRSRVATVRSRLRSLS